MSVQWGNPQEQAQAERIAAALNNPQPRRTIVEKAQNHHLALAAKHIEEYDQRTRLDKNVDTPVRQLFEDRAYKRAMMHAAFAQAQAATRQAEALESLLELAQEGNK